MSSYDPELLAGGLAGWLAGWIPGCRGISQPRLESVWELERERISMPGRERETDRMHMSERERISMSGREREREMWAATDQFPLEFNEKLFRICSGLRRISFHFQLEFN